MQNFNARTTQSPQFIRENTAEVARLQRELDKMADGLERIHQAARKVDKQP